MKNWPSAVAVDARLRPHRRGRNRSARDHPLHLDTLWGQAQVRRYIADLERGIARLATGEGTFNDLSTLYPALRMSHCMHHYVFCLPREQVLSLIVAILHERMDLMVRLAGRL